MYRPSWGDSRLLGVDVRCFCKYEPRHDYLLSFQNRPDRLIHEKAEISRLQPLAACRFIDFWKQRQRTHPRR